MRWGSTLRDYAYPVMGGLPINEVGTEHVPQCLTAIWFSMPETAGRVRGRIETILDYGKARGWRAGENPARWRGHLALTLPARSKVRRVEGHASLPCRDMPAFWPRLQAADGMGARALEFAILTAGRTGEVLGALCSEIDLDAMTWTIPGERMKAGKPLSNMAMKQALRRMNRDDLIPHGFRSPFRTWATEQTSTPHEICEAALAHTQGDKGMPRIREAICWISGSD